MRKPNQCLAALSLAAFAFALATTPSVAAGKVVHLDASVEAGTILVRTSERRLYFALGEGRAIRYVVGVGRVGRQWAGSSFIDGKHIRPNWAPPADVRRDRPKGPDLIAAGSPANPLGVAALTLSGGEYAIHGTNAPDSVGGFVSYGCIRMHNRDIIDLFNRVEVGTPVIVVH